MCASLFSSLSLRASRECQNKEKLLEQRFRSSLHDFRQWLVNANISTAKCFDSPHSIQDASAALQRIQVSGELLFPGGLILPGHDSRLIASLTTACCLFSCHVHKGGQYMIKWPSIPGPMGQFRRPPYSQRCARLGYL